MKKLGSVFIVSALAGAFLLMSSIFVVGQGEQALVLQFGKFVRDEREPGLKFKLPFIQNVEIYDKKLLDFDMDASREFLAGDQKWLVVDAFVRYRIVDPLRFKQAVGDEFTMRSRMNTILDSSLRQVLGSVPLGDVISTKRADIMRQVRDLMNQQVTSKAATAATADGDAAKERRGFGIEVVDVRIVRADLPQANSESIYKRMQTERDQEAKKFRATGARDAQEIRSKADKDRTVILAEARKKAEILRGEGDGEAAHVFAASFGQDPEFFQFYRSMQAYRKALSAKDTTVILSPESEFLGYMERAR